MNVDMTLLKPFGVELKARSKGSSVDSLDIGKLREMFREHQLVILRGFNEFNSSESFSHYCNSWGEVSLWPFGKVLELIEQENPKDHIFDSNYVPLHWDGMYRPQVPEYQIFHCVKAPAREHGGRTTFSNTTLVLENSSKDLITLWNKVTGSYERQMEFYNSKTISPIITKHPFRDHLVIRYNELPCSNDESFLNPPSLSFSGLEEKERELFHTSLKEALYAPANFYAHEWQDGDIVIADNFSLLHGREKFSSGSSRHIQRVHVLSDPPLDNPGLESYK